MLPTKAVLQHYQEDFLSNFKVVFLGRSKKKKSLHRSNTAQKMKFYIKDFFSRNP